MAGAVGLRGCGQTPHVRHEKPKRLFVRELCRNARRSLQAEQLMLALAAPARGRKWFDRARGVLQCSLRLGLRLQWRYQCGRAQPVKIGCAFWIRSVLATASACRYALTGWRTGAGNLTGSAARSGWGAVAGLAMPPLRLTLSPSNPANWARSP